MSGERDLVLVPNCIAEIKFRAAHVPLHSQTVHLRKPCSACLGPRCTPSEAAAFGLTLQIYLVLSLSLLASFISQLLRQLPPAVLLLVQIVSCLLTWSHVFRRKVGV